MNVLRIALCAIAKDENYYINDWIQYHLNLGIDHIYLYDNNDLEDVGKYIDRKFSNQVTIIDVHGKSRFQIKAYNECFSKYAKFNDWMLFIDIDEFLTLSVNDKTLKEVLSDERYYKYDAIRLNWQIMRSNDIWGDLSIPVTERFNIVVNSMEAKSFVNCSSTGLEIRVHSPLRNGSVPHQCLPDGRPVNDNSGLVKGISVDRVDTSVMYIRHFKTKTPSEYKLTKLNKSNAIDQESRTNIMYFQDTNGKDSEVENFLLNFPKEEIKIRLEKTWTTKPEETIA